MGVGILVGVGFGKRMMFFVGGFCFNVFFGGRYVFLWGMGGGFWRVEGWKSLLWVIEEKFE